MSANNCLNFQGIPLDVSSMAFDMAEGCLTELKEIFFLEGKYPPIIRWCSYAHSDWPKPHQILSQYWCDNYYAEKFSIGDFTSNPNTKMIAPYIVHFKETPEGNNFYYNYVGERVCEFMKLDGIQKDKDLFSIVQKTKQANDLLNLVSLMACVVRGQGMIILSQDGTEQQPVLWNKMIVPLMDKNGKVIEILACLLRMPPR